MGAFSLQPCHFRRPQRLWEEPALSLFGRGGGQGSEMEQLAQVPWQVAQSCYSIPPTMSLSTGPSLANQESCPSAITKPTPSPWSLPQGLKTYVHAKHRSQQPQGDAGPMSITRIVTFHTPDIVQLGKGLSTDTRRVGYCDSSQTQQATSATPLV